MIATPQALSCHRKIGINFTAEFARTWMRYFNIYMCICLRVFVQNIALTFFLFASNSYDSASFARGLSNLSEFLIGIYRIDLVTLL